jgi:hypothetical protein
MPGMQPWFSAAARRTAERLERAHRRLVGRELPGVPAHSGRVAEDVWESDAVVVAHGTQADPVLCYGNRAGLALWARSWEEFTRTPSRFTAEEPERGGRARLLAAVSARGFIEDYTGVRITGDGRRFRIHRATVWNFSDEADLPAGQAATFGEWEWL